MPFNWPDYLDLARELNTPTTNFKSGKEAQLRSAISRAYYGAAIQARNFLLERGVEVPSGSNVHWFVIDRFNHSIDRYQLKIGQNLNRLRQLRNKADYSDNFPGLESQVDLAIYLADQVIKLLLEIQ